MVMRFVHSMWWTGPNIHTKKFIGANAQMLREYISNVERRRQRRFQRALSLIKHDVLYHTHTHLRIHPHPAPLSGRFRFFKRRPFVLCECPYYAYGARKLCEVHFAFFANSVEMEIDIFLWTLDLSVRKGKTGRIFYMHAWFMVLRAPLGKALRIGDDDLSDDDAIVLYAVYMYTRSRTSVVASNCTD